MNMRTLIPWGRENEVSTTRSGEEPSPFLALHRQVNRLFDDFFRDFDTPFSHNGRSGNWPSVEVSEGDKEVKVVAELPGLEEKDIDVTLNDGILTLKGEKKHEADGRETNGSFYSERWHGRFERTLRLGADVDPNKVKASFKQGVLTISVEKRPEAQRQVKRITINRGN